MDNITRQLEVKGELMKKGLCLSEVARRLNISHSTVSLVVSGKAESRRVADYIELILGRKPGSLFPYVLHVPDRRRKQNQEQAKKIVSNC